MFYNNRLTGFASVMSYEFLKRKEGEEVDPESYLYMKKFEAK